MRSTITQCVNGHLVRQICRDEITKYTIRRREIEQKINCHFLDQLNKNIFRGVSFPSPELREEEQYWKKRHQRIENGLINSNSITIMDAYPKSPILIYSDEETAHRIARYLYQIM